MVDGLHQPGTEDLLAAVLGQVQEVVAGMCHGQVLLPTGGGLDDDAQAGHAIDGNAVAARQEHWEKQREGWAVQAPEGKLHPHPHRRTPSGGAEMLNELHTGHGWPHRGGAEEQRQEARPLLGAWMRKSHSTPFL